MRRRRVTIPMLHRMTELREAGLGFSAIAAVITLDWGTEISESQVRYHLRHHWLRRSRGGFGRAKPGNGANLPPNPGGRVAA